MLTNAQQKFVTDIYNLCNRIGVAYNNLCPIAVTAQACIESNYGRSTLSKDHFNFFGLKCGKNWQGKRVKYKTKEEYVQGQLVTIYAEFRAYDNIEQGVQGYYEFVDTKRYENLKGITDPTLYALRIKADGYATSYSYVSTMISVIDKIKPYCNQNLIEDDVYRIALEVIDGKWDNGEERKKRLSIFGYDYNIIQSKVNAILKEKA